MAAQQTHYRIKLNLLHPQGVSEKLLARFLRWLISYGRFIVVAVEAVVIGAFIMRFSLDAKLDDLKSKINTDVPLVLNLNLDEALIKQTQLRLSTIKKTFDKEADWTNLLTNLTSILPVKIIFTNVNMERSNSGQVQFKINAQTDSHLYLSQYLDNLKKDSNFKDINLASINYNQGQIVFTITGQTK